MADRNSLGGFFTGASEGAQRFSALQRDSELVDLQKEREKRIQEDLDRRTRNDETRADQIAQEAIQRTISSGGEAVSRGARPGQVARQIGAVTGQDPKDLRQRLRAFRTRPDAGAALDARLKDLDDRGDATLNMQARVGDQTAGALLRARRREHGREQRQSTFGDTLKTLRGSDPDALTAAIPQAEQELAAMQSSGRGNSVRARNLRGALDAARGSLPGVQDRRLRASVDEATQTTAARNRINEPREQAGRDRAEVERVVDAFNSTYRSALTSQFGDDRFAAVMENLINRGKNSGEILSEAHAQGNQDVTPEKVARAEAIAVEIAVQQLARFRDREDLFEQAISRLTFSDEVALTIVQRIRQLRLADRRQAR